MSHYIFNLSEKVKRESVSYKNRYGIQVAADLYLPKDLDESKKYPGIIIGGPYGGVKEQGSGIYAQNMAERGFVALAFDPAYNGESGGEPRHVSSPDSFVEDFSAAVDYVGTRSYVDREKIGAIGICGSGGFVLSATKVDHRIKAVATANMYEISRYTRNGWQDTMTDDQRTDFLKALGEQRWKDFENESPQLSPEFPTEIPEELDPITSEIYEFYLTPRGQHPNSIGAFTLTSNISFINFSLLSDLEFISPRPILFILGENAHSRYFTEDAYKMASEPKELFVVDEARHIDLYDRTDLIPFNKLETFFKENLK